MHASERPQEGAQPRARSFTRVAVDFAYTITIVIARPLVLSVIDRRMREIQPLVTAVLVRIHDGPVRRDGFAQNALAEVALSLWPTTQHRSKPLSRLMI